MYRYLWVDLAEVARRYGNALLQGPTKGGHASCAPHGEVRGLREDHGEGRVRVEQYGGSGHVGVEGVA